MTRFKVSGMYRLPAAQNNKGQRIKISTRVSEVIEADDEEIAVNTAIVDLLLAHDVDLGMCNYELEEHTLKAIDVRDLAMDARENHRMMKAIGAPSLFDAEATA